MERDLRDEAMHHGETNTESKDEQQPAKVYGGNLMLYAPIESSHETKQAFK